MYDVFGKLKTWLNMVGRQLEQKLQLLKSNNGEEYTSNDMDFFMSSSGNISCPTALYNPHQNDVAERLNMTIRDII